MNAPLALGHGHARLGERVKRGAHIARLGADQIERSARDRRGAGVAAGLDAIGHDAIRRPVQPIPTLDLQRFGADAVDRRAHRDQAVAQIDDFRLARGIFDAGAALCGHRRHQCVFGRADRYHRKGDSPAWQAAPRRGGLDVAGGELDHRAHFLERLQMQVDRPVADRTAARQRYRRLAAAADQRPQHEDRRAHLADDVIGRFGRGQLAGADRHHPAEILGPRTFDLSRGAQLVKQMAEAIDIGQSRQIAQRQRFVGQQGAGHQRQRGVLGAGNRKTARKTVAAANENAVHLPASNRSARPRKASIMRSID